MLRCTIFPTYLSIQDPQEWQMLVLDCLKAKHDWVVDVKLTTYNIYNPTIDTIRVLCYCFNLEII